MQQVIVSFTTTPDRIEHIQPMIESLEKQSYPHFRTILWLCHTYTRSKKKMTQKEVPFFILASNIEVRFTEDYGSNTKLLPTLKLITDPNSILITADDDTIYPVDWLKGLVEASVEDGTRAYGYRGKIFKRKKLPFLPWIKRVLRYEESKTLFFPKASQSKKVDLLTGVWGICYRRSFFNDSYFKLDECKAALHNDDIWANGHLARNLIERICIGIPERFQDIDMEAEGIKRLWDSVNNGQGLNNQVFKYFKHDF